MNFVYELRTRYMQRSQVGVAMLNSALLAPLIPAWWGKDIPNQDLACFVHYLKIINTVMYILKQIVWETQKIALLQNQ